MLVVRVASVPALLVLGSGEDGLSGPMVKMLLINCLSKAVASNGIELAQINAWWNEEREVVIAFLTVPAELTLLFTTLGLGLPVADNSDQSQSGSISSVQCVLVLLEELPDRITKCIWTLICDLEGPLWGWHNFIL